MVDSKIKKATVSAAKKNITASGVRIENGTFVDDEGSIVDRIAEKLPEGTTIFDIKISIEISDEESGCTHLLPYRQSAVLLLY